MNEAEQRSVASWLAHAHGPARLVAAFATAIGLATAGIARADEYRPITPSATASRVVLTGSNLTVAQVIAVARDGATVSYAPAAIARAVAGRDLMLEADAEGVSVYGVNRGAGAMREVHTHREEQPDLRPLSSNDDGAPPEIADEALVRANMVIRANTVPANTATPEFMQALVDLLNKHVTPVMYSRGSLGEGDLFVDDIVELTLSGRRDAYYRGVRMSAADALRRADIAQRTFGHLDVGGTNDAYGTALAAFMVADGEAALRWADLILAMDLDAMDSSVTPMVAPVQAVRPFPWVNWEAARLLDMLRGSYLFADDPHRVLQDPESMRAAYSRQGSAWQAWAALRDAVTLQLNASAANPIPVLDANPGDAWALATPQLQKFYVHGGPLSHGRHGYVLSTANWDPYPMANAMEAFTNALANMDASVSQRIERFSDRTPTAFFTGIKPADVLSPEQLRLSPRLSEPYFLFLDLWGEIAAAAQSLPVQSIAADVGVADLDAQTRLKGERGRQVIDLTMQLLGYDLLTASYWLDVRKAQNEQRVFGSAPTAVWTTFRHLQPWQAEPAAREDLPFGIVANRFMRANPPERFSPAAPPMPAGSAN